MTFDLAVDVVGIPSAANGLNLVVGEGVKCDTGASCFIFVVGGGLKLVGG